jgi:hypothetical protein
MSFLPIGSTLELSFAGRCFRLPFDLEPVKLAKIYAFEYQFPTPSTPGRPEIRRRHDRDPPRQRQKVDCVIDFTTDPQCYRHWKLEIEGPVARLLLDVAEDGGLKPGYELKLNSYDLSVDIELFDAMQRLRFEHPEVKAVIVTSGKERVFSAGANIRMLSQSSHVEKVNFC